MPERVVILEAYFSKSKSFQKYCVNSYLSHRKLGLSCVYFGDHITTEYNMYYATYCIFFSLFLTRAR